MFGELMSDYIEDPIEATIVEEERREMALDAHDDLEDAISEFNKQVLDDRDKLNELVENYESTPHEFDQLFVDAFARRRQEVEAIWKQRSAMLLHIKADEWETIIISAKAEAAEDKK
jgi:hypothetical protein